MAPCAPGFVLFEGACAATWVGSRTGDGPRRVRHGGGTCGRRHPPHGFAAAAQDVAGQVAPTRGAVEHRAVRGGDDGPRVDQHIDRFGPERRDGLARGMEGWRRLRHGTPARGGGEIARGAVACGEHHGSAQSAFERDRHVEAVDDHASASQFVHASARARVTLQVGAGKAQQGGAFARHEPPPVGDEAGGSASAVAALQQQRQVGHRRAQVRRSRGREGAHPPDRGAYAWRGLRLACACGGLRASWLRGVARGWPPNSPRASRADSRGLAQHAVVGGEGGIRTLGGPRTCRGLLG